MAHRTHFSLVMTLYILVTLLAAVSLLFVHLLSSSDVVLQSFSFKQLIHIALSVLTFSVMCLAGMQAVLLALQDWQLRHKRNKGLFHQLPPIESMESLLFQMIGVGFVLLTVLIITSFVFFHQTVTITLVQKTTFSLLAWLVFAALLWGRVFAGWRGKLALRMTLLGVALIGIAYFGSKLITGF